MDKRAARELAKTTPGSRTRMRSSVQRSAIQTRIQDILAEPKLLEQTHSLMITVVQADLAIDGIGIPFDKNEEQLWWRKRTLWNRWGRSRNTLEH